jgi:hypothetical protein
MYGKLNGKLRAVRKKTRGNRLIQMKSVKKLERTGLIYKSRKIIIEKHYVNLFMRLCK